MIYLKPNWRNLSYFVSFILITAIFPIVLTFDFSKCEPECQGIECLSCKDWELKFVKLIDSLSPLNLLNLPFLLLELLIFYLISCFMVLIYIPDKMDE